MPLYNSVDISPKSVFDAEPETEMSEKQAVELRELSQRAGEPFDASLTYRQAQRRIAHLQEYLK